MSHRWKDKRAYTVEQLAPSPNLQYGLSRHFAWCSSNFTLVSRFSFLFYLVPVANCIAGIWQQRQTKLDRFFIVLFFAAELNQSSTYYGPRWDQLLFLSVLPRPWSNSEHTVLLLFRLDGLKLLLDSCGLISFCFISILHGIIAIYSLQLIVTIQLYYLRDCESTDIRLARVLILVAVLSLVRYFST